jgi:hypothetical protein
MPYPRSLPHGVENGSDSARSVQNPSHFDYVRSSQGKLPKINFPVFSGEELQLWHSYCENYFNYGLGSHLCMLMVRRCAGFSQ